MIYDLSHNYSGPRTAVEISRYLESAIASGALAAGARLPTVRAWAEELGCSPATVAAAYATLRQRGLVVSEGRRGTRVSDRPPVAVASFARAPAGVRDLASGNPDAALLPELRPALDRIDTRHHLYGDALIEPALAELARESFAHSGVPAGSVGVTSGALDGIERVLAAHLRPGDRVAVEDPAWSGVLHLLPALGLAAVPVALDDEGPLPRALETALAAGARAFILTPRAQNPSGARLTPERAEALRALLARHPDVLLIEDDHAGSAAGAAVHTLTDASPHHWVTIRSVSKVYGPDLRLALLCGDPTTVSRMEGRQLVGVRWVSFLLQRLVVELWRAPETRALLDRAERTIASRREALLAALAAHGIEARGVSGFNVWIPVREESALVQGLLADGWAVAPGERFRLQSPPAIRVTVSTLEPGEAARFAADLAGRLHPGGRTLPV